MYDEQLDKITQRELNPIVNEKINLAHSHISDTVPHVSANDRTRWDSAADMPTATGSNDGLFSKEDKAKLDAIEENANNYIHPKSGVSVGTYLLTAVNEYGHVVGGSNPSTLDISVSNALKFNNQTPDYYAPKANPIFLGHPQSPTPDADSNDFSIANTKWVDSRITKYHNEKIILGVDFTGSCTVPTPNKSSNDTKVPNTSWVRSIIDEYLSKYKPVIVGIPYIWHSDTLPKDAFWCDGSSFDKDKYPLLAMVYPSGRVPDYRGVVLRMRDRGKGYDPNRTLGSFQSDAIRNITGTFGLWKGIGNVGGVFANTGHTWDCNSKNGGGDPGYNISFDASRSVPTASENRMKNIAVNYIVFATGYSVLETADTPVKSYVTTVEQPENGVIRLNGDSINSATYNEGDQIIVQASANDGYNITSLLVDGVKQTNPYNLTVSKAHKISATIAENTYVVNVGSTDGATVTLNGENVKTLTVKKGDQVVINATPNTGYKLDAVYVDCIAVEVPYTVTISKSIYVSVETVSNTHTITIVQPGTGGFVTIDGEVTTSYIINDGDTVTVSATLSDGYELDFVNIDNIRYTTIPQEISPTKDISIYAQFRIKQTTPTPTPTEPGTDSTVTA